MILSNEDQYMHAGNLIYNLRSSDLLRDLRVSVRYCHLTFNAGMETTSTLFCYTLNYECKNQ